MLAKLRNVQIINVLMIELYIKNGKILIDCILNNSRLFHNLFKVNSSNAKKTIFITTYLHI